MKRTLPLLALCLPFLVAACNTMEGAGQDISAGGRAVTNSAAHAKENLEDKPQSQPDPFTL